MKCFYHRAADAVALCKSCSRGLCLDCAADVPPGTACRGRCEGEVRSINEMLERGKSAYQKVGRQNRRNATMMFLMGSIFTVLGVLPVIVSGNYSASFLAVLGLMFIFWSLLTLKSGRQIESMEPMDRTTPPPLK